MTIIPASKPTATLNMLKAADFWTCKQLISCLCYDIHIWSYLSFIAEKDYHCCAVYWNVYFVYVHRMQRIFRHHGIKGNLADDDELDDVGEKFDIVTDANDHILEKVVRDLCQFNI